MCSHELVKNPVPLDMLWRILNAENTESSAHSAVLKESDGCLTAA